MDEEFQYTNKFLRDNKNFILSLFCRDIKEDEVAEWDDEKIDAACFSRYVESVLDVMSCVVNTLCDNRLKHTAVEKYFGEFQNSPTCMLVQKFLHDKKLANFICKFITVDVLKKYLNSTIKSHPEYLQSNDALLSYAKQLDDRLTSDISPYKFLILLVFCRWYMAQTSDNEYSELDENIRFSFYHAKFKSNSWLACLEYFIKSDCTEGKFHQALDNIIEDYTKIEHSGAKETLHNCLLAFSIIFKHFIVQDSTWIETDGRENFCGIIIPQEQTKEERRIEVAADYLVKYHYIAEDYKNLFIGIMNNPYLSGRIKFLNGGMDGGKEKGGKGVLYAIIRFIREDNFDPNAKIEAKRQSIPDYSDDCEHFIFDKDTDDKKGEEKWKKIKDCGRKSRSLQNIITDLNKELKH